MSMSTRCRALLRTYSRVIQEQDGIVFCEILVCELALIFCEIELDVDRGRFCL